MSDIDKKWYVVRAISGQEKKIKDVLEAEIAAAGLQHYVGLALLIYLLYLQFLRKDKVLHIQNLTLHLVACPHQIENLHFFPFLYILLLKRE